MKVHALVLAAGLAWLSGCASAPPGAESIAPQAPLCAPGVSLGKVAVAPVTRWRTDQKEPEVREAIVMKAVQAIAPSITCAASTGVLPMSADADATARLAEAKAEGAKTIIFIRVEELGPIAIVSFPALWSTWSDVKFTLEAVDVATGTVLRSIPHHRQKGGAFEARGLEPPQGEMELALRDVILGAR